MVHTVRIKRIRSWPDLYNERIHPISLMHIDHLINSALCESGGSPFFEGQSILSTVAIHAARNSYLGEDCANPNTFNNTSINKIGGSPHLIE